MLYLYVINKGSKIVELSEYEVLKQEDKILNYFNLDYLDTSNLVVESWFSKLEVEVEKVTPYFDKLICGKYEIVYKILNNQNVVCRLTNNLIVEEYTNFVNNGVYNQGKVLEFFGTAKLNKENIYYGTKIDIPGEYDIEITNVNGEVTTFHIYIVPNYYKEENIKNLTSINVHNDTAYVNIELNQKQVKEVIVDKENYENYEIIDDVLVIKFPYSSSRVISHTLDEIVFLNKDDEIYYRIDQQLTFNYLKQNPKIIINKIIEENSFKINLDIDDVDKTFMYIKAYYGDNEQNCKEKIFTSFDDINGSYLKLLFVFDLGNGVICEYLISEVKQNEVFNSNIDIIYEDGMLKSINIIHNLEANNLNVLNVSNDLNSYLEYYEKLKPSSYLKSIIIISVVIFLGTGFVFGVYILLKKSKKKSF